jgi:hypothetical protein
MDVNVDLISNGLAQGEVANQLMANGRLNIGAMRPFMDFDDNGKFLGSYISIYKGGNPKLISNYQSQLVANATLRRDEWKQLDDAILEEGKYRLGGIEDLVSKGLTYNLGNAMGTTILEWHDVAGSMTAELTMDGVSRSKNDRPNFQYNYLPIPIISVDYEINARELAASRSLGNPLDTTIAGRAARAVNEQLENMLFTDTTYGYGEKDSRERNKIYSYINFPDRITKAIGAHWDDGDFDSDGGAGPDKIVNDVADMKAKSIAAYQNGPWMLYIPTAYEVTIDKDYNRTSGKTIRERIMQISGIQGIKVIDTLPANNVLLVQMKPDTVRLVRGMGLQNVEWQVEGKLLNKYKVMTIQVPQIRSDQNGKCGIVHMA